MPKEKFSPVWAPGAAAMALTKDEEIPCRLCEEPTPMLGTKLCDRCWELETRIHMNPEIATRILNKLGFDTEFNLNGTIWVKLTKFGRDQLRAQHELLRENIPSASPAWPYSGPIETKEGWSKWQMHSITSQLGGYLTIGGVSPFNPNIILKGVKYHAKAS